MRRWPHGASGWWTRPSSVAPAGAETGNLTLMVGGDAEAIEGVKDVLETTVGGWLWERTIPQKVLKGDFEPGFTADLMHKDLGLAIQTAHEVGVPLTLGAVVRERYTDARARAGREGLDRHPEAVGGRRGGRGSRGVVNRCHGHHTGRKEHST